MNKAQALAAAKQALKERDDAVASIQAFQAGSKQERDTLQKENATLKDRLDRIEREVVCYKSKHDARYIRWIVKRDPVVLGPAQKRRLLAIATRLTPQGTFHAR